MSMFFRTASRRSFRIGRLFVMNRTIFYTSIKFLFSQDRSILIHVKVHPKTYWYLA